MYDLYVLVSIAPRKKDAEGRCQVARCLSSNCLEELRIKEMNRLWWVNYIPLKRVGHLSNALNPASIGPPAERGSVTKLDK